MPTRSTENALWQAVEAKLQTPVPPEVRSFCRARGLVGDYLLVDDDLREEYREQRSEGVAVVADFVQDLWNSGVVSRESDSFVSPLRSDRRWPLLRKLNAAYHQAEANAPGSSDWSPVRVSRVALNFDAFPTTSEVVVRFDDRLSLHALKNALRNVWPELHRRGWLRRSRPLGERALTLLRFVCLEMPPDATWRARLEGWNLAHPSWVYSGVRAFERDFRRAEEELTGERHALELFYNPLARLDLPELYRARRAGTKGARQLITRRLAQMRRTNDAMRRALSQRRAGGDRKKRSSRHAARQDRTAVLGREPAETAWRAARRQFDYHLPAYLPHTPPGA